MEELDFEKSLLHLKVKWKDPSFITRYALLIIILPFPVVSFLFLKEQYDNYHSSWTYYYPYIIAFLVALTLAALYFKALFQNDRFTIIAISKPGIDIRKKIEVKIQNDGWKINRSNPRYLIAHQPGKLIVRSILIVLFKNGSVYINVQNQQGYRGYSPFSFGRNKRTTTAIIDEIIK